MKDKYILGIGELDKDSGVTLLLNNTFLTSINEERFSKKKLHNGFPYKSLNWVLDNYNISINDLDKIYIAKNINHYKKSPTLKILEKIKFPVPYFNIRYLLEVLDKLYFKYFGSYKYKKNDKKYQKEINEFIQNHNLNKKIQVVDHHFSHVLSSYYVSNYDRCLCFSLDGQGDGLSGTVYEVNNHKFKILKKVELPNSLGIFYNSVTKSLGFKVGRHEGKITGLAAYQKPSKFLINLIANLAYFDKKREIYITPFTYSAFPIIKFLNLFYSKEEIAASFQINLEKVVTSFINYFMIKYNNYNICLSGGVFGNVKLNQKISELKNLNKIFVVPHMGDGGLSQGSAYHYLYEQKQKLLNYDIYSGPQFSNDFVESILNKRKIKFKNYEEIENIIAQKLSEGEIVARFSSKMEHGPRALGNRSILVNAKNSKINNELNNKLSRTEFMPFAPVTLYEFKDEYYYDIEKKIDCMKFMTISCKCKEITKNISPAIVHVDNTARPQLIKFEDNPSYYKILKFYYQLTNIPTLINTSFNNHEEPIVCDPDDAISSCINAKIKYLAIDNFLCEIN